MISDTLPRAITIVLVASITGSRCRAVGPCEAIGQGLIYRLRAPFCWSKCLDATRSKRHGEIRDERIHSIGMLATLAETIRPATSNISAASCNSFRQWRSSIFTAGRRADNILLCHNHLAFIKKLVPRDCQSLFLEISTITGTLDIWTRL